jgi:hypothetical protein
VGERRDAACDGCARNNLWMDLARRRRWCTCKDGKLLKMCGAARGEGEGGGGDPVSQAQWDTMLTARVACQWTIVMLGHSGGGRVVPRIDLVGGMR